MTSQLAMQKKLTEWFIKMGPPSTIVLQPMEETKTPGKGVKRTPADSNRGMQDFKVIWPGGNGFVDSGPDGTHHKFDVIIVGLFDCAAEIGDEWQFDGQKYYIHTEFPFNGYERKFGAYTYGNRPKDGTSSG